jgi:hypothetical protein
LNDRCYLVYARAPEGTSAHAANELLNEYISDHGRGVVAFHDHFVGRPHGGIAVFHVRTEDELAALEDPGPLAGWNLAVHPLTFSLTPVGFAAQTELTLEEYRGKSFEELRAAEAMDKRYWWQRRKRNSRGGESA